MDSETLAFFRSELGKRDDDVWYTWKSGEYYDDHFLVKYENDTLVVEPVNFVDKKIESEYYEEPEYTKEEEGIHLSKIIHYILNCLSVETKVKINGMVIRHFYFKSDFIIFEHGDSFNKLYPKHNEEVFENYRVKLDRLCLFEDTYHSRELEKYDKQIRNKKDQEYWMTTTLELLKNNIISKSDIDKLYEYIKN